MIFEEKKNELNKTVNAMKLVLNECGLQIIPP